VALFSAIRLRFEFRDLAADVDGPDESPGIAVELAPQHGSGAPVPFADRAAKRAAVIESD